MGFEFCDQPNSKPGLPSFVREKIRGAKERIFLEIWKGFLILNLLAN